MLTIISIVGYHLYQAAVVAAMGAHAGVAKVQEGGCTVHESGACQLQAPNIRKPCCVCFAPHSLHSATLRHG